MRLGKAFLHELKISSILRHELHSKKIWNQLPISQTMESTKWVHCGDDIMELVLSQVVEITFNSSNSCNTPQSDHNSSSEDDIHECTSAISGSSDDTHVDGSAMGSDTSSDDIVELFPPQLVWFSSPLKQKVKQKVLGSFVFVFQNFCVPQGTRIEGFGHSFVVARNKGGTIILDPQEVPPLKGFKTFLEAYLPHDEVGSLKRVVGTAVNRGCGAYTIASAAWVYAQLMLHADKPFGLPPDPKALYQYYLKSKNILNDVQVLLTKVSDPGFPAPQARDGVHPLTGCPLISFGGVICLNVQFFLVMTPATHEKGLPWRFSHT